MTKQIITKQLLFTLVRCERVWCFMNETILAKMKTLLLLASVNTLLLAVLTSHQLLESNVKKYTRNSLTSCVYTFF